MGKQILFAINPREKDLHPLLTRKDDLLAKQSRLAHAGEHLPDEEHAELRGLVEQIGAVHAVGRPREGDTSTAASLSVEADYTVQCFGIGRRCNERMDIVHDRNVIADIKSIRIFDPNAAPNLQNVWIYPPNLGTMVLCAACSEKLLDRFAEQRVEIDV